MKMDAQFSQTDLKTDWGPKDEDEHDGSDTVAGLDDVITQLSNTFNAYLITRLNLSGLDAAKSHTFWKGRLPKWILGFPNLQVLDASRSGLLILEPWLLELGQLQVLHLKQNHISTWPSFLSGAERLEIVNLNGNPCLEKAFQKSPSLRSTYFSWLIAEDTVSSVTPYIRGPEWLPAASMRMSKYGIIKDLGYFCGGIYTLSTQENASNDDFLTPLEPCILDTRLAEAKARNKLANIDRSTRSRGNPHGMSTSSSLPSSKTTAISSHSTERKNKHLEPGKTEMGTSSETNDYTETKEEVKRSRLIFEIFDDINALLSRNSHPRSLKRSTDALIVGGPSDSFNKLIPNCSKIGIRAVRDHCHQLLDEERSYVQKLQLVNTHFYHSNIKSSSVTTLLRTVFCGFPSMLSIHTKCILPVFSKLVKRMDEAVDESGPPGIGPKRNGAEASVMPAVVDLCTAFRQLYMALQTYAGNLTHAEYLLDTKKAVTKLYEDDDFGQRVQTQADRLGTRLVGQFGMSKGMQNPTSLALQLASGISSNDEPPRPSLVLSQWLEKDKNRHAWQALHPPINFIYLPLVRLVRNDRFFTSLASSSSVFRPVVHTIRWLRQLVSREVEKVRQRERSHALVVKFHTLPSYFEAYEWDALLAVRSRSYFEPGILARNTNDVLDVDDTPVSLVKEVFGENRMRLLRLVCCHGEIQIWDELLEHLVGRVPRERVRALDPPTSSGPRQVQKQHDVRIVFVDVRETCLVQVKGFAARYVAGASPRQDFIDACEAPCKVTF